MKLKETLQYLFFLALAAGLVWLAIYTGTINPTQLWADISQAKFQYVGLMIALTVVAHGLRAARWRMLLEPLGYRPSFMAVNNAVWLGYFANNLVPRLGEITRCSTLWKSDGIPIEKSLGTVVTDRIFDVLCLFIVLVLNLVLDFDRLSGFILEATSSTSQEKSPVLLYLVGIILLGTGILWFLRERLFKIPLIQKIWGIFLGLLDGLMSVRKLKKPWLFVAYTIGIWSFYWLMGYVLFFAIDKFAGLSPMVGLTILAAGALAMLLPTPGGVGAYNFIVGEALLKIYQIPAPDNGTLASFIQSSQMISTLLIGAIIYVLMFFFPTKSNAK